MPLFLRESWILYRAMQYKPKRMIHLINMKGEKYELWACFPSSDISIVV